MSKNFGRLTSSWVDQWVVLGILTGSINGFLSTMCFIQIQIIHILIYLAGWKYTCWEKVQFMVWDSRYSGTSKTPRLQDFRILFVYLVFIFVFTFFVTRSCFGRLKLIFQISLLGWTIQFQYLICIWMPACESSIPSPSYQSSSMVSHYPGAWGVGPPP